METFLGIFVEVEKNGNPSGILFITVVGMPRTLSKSYPILMNVSPSGINLFFKSADIKYTSVAENLHMYLYTYVMNYRY